MKRRQCVDCGRRMPVKKLRHMDVERHWYSCRKRYLCLSWKSWTAGGFAR